jgi:hypothetical protein
VSFVDDAGLGFVEHAVDEALDLSGRA